MEPTQKGVEITNPTLGSIRIFGMDANTLFTVFTFIASTAAAVLLFTHVGEAKEGNKETAQAFKENNKEVAAVLKETQKEMMQILREMASAAREQNCLLAMPQDRRAPNAELCKRIAQ